MREELRRLRRARVARNGWTPQRPNGALVEKAWLELLNKGRRRVRCVQCRSTSPRAVRALERQRHDDEPPGPGMADARAARGCAIHSTSNLRRFVCIGLSRIGTRDGTASIGDGDAAFLRWPRETRTAAGAWGDSVSFAMGASTAAPTASPSLHSALQSSK